jgi:hypothetical protein
MNENLSYCNLSEENWPSYGAGPARQAAAKSPIEALRYE